MNYIELKNVTKQFGKGDNVFLALNDASLIIEKGEMIAIMGPSGSGKSTLLNILGTLLKTTSGSYSYNNQEVTKLNSTKLAKLRNKSFGFIVQNFALINSYTIEENIMLPLIYAGIAKKIRKERVNTLLKDLGIEDKKNKLPIELSGGQCQRVAIARALANNPQVIFADEPTGSLDTQNGNQIMEIFKKLNEEGTTIVIVTHDINIAKNCNRIINIVDGKII